MLPLTARLILEGPEDDEGAEYVEEEEEEDEEDGEEEEDVTVTVPGKEAP